MSCVICGMESEIHHLYSRKAFPELKEASFNKIRLCRKHHQEVHSRGIKFMVKTYPDFERWMRDRNWMWDPILLRWFHERKA
jgi:predicted transposase YbfD/YdcC